MFVFPSLFEGSAVVTYEALASGLPSVVTPSAGSVVAMASKVSSSLQARSRIWLAVWNSSEITPACEPGWQGSALLERPDVRLASVP